METTTKKTKILLWSSLIVALIVIGIILYRRLKAKQGHTDSQAVLYNCQNTRTAQFPLTIGSNGWQVELLQRIHNNCPDWNGDRLTTDGIWGTKTNEAFADSFGTTIFGEDSFLSYINYYKVYLYE